MYSYETVISLLLPRFVQNSPTFGYSYTWTSLYMDGTAVNFFLLIFPHEARILDSNYTLGVDFLDYDFL